MLVLALSGKAREVFALVALKAKLNPKLTLGELKKRRLPVMWKEQ